MLPELVTRRLVLRPAVPADVEELHALWTAPDVRRYMFDDAVVTRENVSDMVREFASHNDRGLGLWALVGPGTDSAVGEIGLAPATEIAQIDPRLHGETEVEIALHPAPWGRMLAAEALDAVLDHGFVTLGLARILGVVDVPNVASRRLLERAGFDYAYTVEGAVYPADILFASRL